MKYSATFVASIIVAFVYSNHIQDKSPLHWSNLASCYVDRPLVVEGTLFVMGTETEIPIWKNRSLIDLDGEVWKDVIGYVGSYMVSNMGRVKSLARHPHKRYAALKTAILAQEKQKSGYLQVSMSADRVVSRIKTHRLVAIHFHPNPENKPQINHKNGIKTDNRDINVEWATRSENQVHSLDTGLRGTKLTLEEVNLMRSLYAKGVPMKQIELIHLNGKVGYTTVVRICKGVKWKRFKNQQQ